MTDRVHASLDGELSRNALSADERARLDSLARSTADAAAVLRAAPAPDLSEAVLRRIDSLAEAAPRPSPAGSMAATLQRAIGWLWRPRSLALTMRPAYAFAALGLVVAAAFGARATDERAPMMAAEPASSVVQNPSFYVQFRLDAAGASQVALAGSFTGWEPLYTLEQSTPGVWTVMVPLSPGVHDYTFLVDGERWVIDPTAPRVDDSFGGSNSRLFLAAGGDAT